MKLKRVSFWFCGLFYLSFSFAPMIYLNCVYLLCSVISPHLLLLFFLYPVSWASWIIGYGSKCCQCIVSLDLIFGIWIRYKYQSWYDPFTALSRIIIMPYLLFFFFCEKENSSHSSHPSSGNLRMHDTAQTLISMTQIG